MRTRPLLAALTVALAASVATLAGGGRATAAPARIAPDAQAWWNVANAGGPAPQPAAPPGVATNDLLVAGSKGDHTVPGAPASPPSPFDSVGDKGAASAIAAVRYTIPAGAAIDHLVLKFDGSAPPSVSMAACRVTSPGGTFTAEQNGPWADVPPYDCTVPSLGAFNSDNTGLQFGDIGGLAKGNVLSVVIVAQVLAYTAFQPPGPDSLSLRSAPPPFDAGNLPAALPDFGSVPPSPAAAPYLPPAATLPLAGPTGAPAAPPSSAATVQGDPAPRQILRPAAALPGLDDARARLAAALALAAVLAAFGWMVAGDTPRLRRALAARLAGPGVVIPEPETSRGLGRFRRARKGRPPQV